MGLRRGHGAGGLSPHAASPLTDNIQEYFRLRDALGDCVRYLSVLDAQEIRKACRGWGTDESKLTGVLSSRTGDHLQRINAIYVDRYDRTLVGPSPSRKQQQTVHPVSKHMAR